MQSTYFLICNVYYIYHNPQYRVLWAAFCVQQPTNINIKAKGTHDTLPPVIVQSGCTSSHTSSLTFQTYTTTNERDTADASTSQPSKSTDNHNSLGQEMDPLPEDLVFDSTQILTKHSAFIHYGLETVSHCILTQLFLICLLFALCIRLSVATITYRSTWAQHKGFCPYTYTLEAIGYLSAHSILQVILCIPALKTQYMYDTSRCHRMLPIVSIVFMIVSVPLQMITPILATHEVVMVNGVAVCLFSRLRQNPFLTAFLMFNYYFSFVLCFITVIVPICVQRNILINLPENQENEALLALITKINVMSKRVCGSAMIVIVLSVLIHVLLWIYASNAKVEPFISIGLWSFGVQRYLVIVFIYKDWNVRLCPLCHYESCAKKSSSSGSNLNEMGVELVSKLSSSMPMGVPGLVRDVSKREVRDETFETIELELAED
eukprot:18327_1